MATRELNIKRFENLLGSVKRDGISSLMNYIREKSDFYTAPASTKYHLACKGGLLQHSLNVYDCLLAKKVSPIWKDHLENVSDESIILTALLHDLCKVNFYSVGQKNQKTYDPEKVMAVKDQWQIKHDDKGDFIWETVDVYEIDDTMPLGHGEKSVMLILGHGIKLKPEEIFAIRWHMGYAEEKSQYKSIGDAMEMYPLVLALHEADMEASKLLEGELGNK